MDIGLERKIIKALGLECERVFSLTLHMRVGEVTTLEVGKYVGSGDLDALPMVFEVCELVPAEDVGCGNG